MGGKPHGRGVCVYSDGGRYEGDWVEGKREGKGRMTWADGRMYNGQWKGDVREGHGMEENQKGDVFDGQYKADKKEGKGAMTWKDGTVFLGTWSNGKRNGQGTYTGIDRKTYSGLWKNDEQVVDKVNDKSEKEKKEKEKKVYKGYSDDIIDVKCCVVGDCGDKRTQLVISYVQNTFPENYIATVFDNYESLQVVDGRTVHLQLWNTVGQEEYDRLRGLSYVDTEVFLVCFSIIDRVAFQNVEIKWIPEIKLYSKKIPIILVGMEAEYRDRPGSHSLVGAAEAEAVVQRLSLVKYIECSAKTQQNLSTVFEEAARAALENNCTASEPEPKKKSCSIQ